PTDPALIPEPEVDEQGYPNLYLPDGKNTRIMQLQHREQYEMLTAEDEPGYQLRIDYLKPYYFTDWFLVDRKEGTMYAVYTNHIERIAVAALPVPHFLDDLTNMLERDRRDRAELDRLNEEFEAREAAGKAELAKAEAARRAHEAAEEAARHPINDHSLCPLVRSGPKIHSGKVFHHEDRIDVMNHKADIIHEMASVSEWHKYKVLQYPDYAESYGVQRTVLMAKHKEVFDSYDAILEVDDALRIKQGLPRLPKSYYFPAEGEMLSSTPMTIYSRAMDEVDKLTKGTRRIIKMHKEQREEVKSPNSQGSFNTLLKIVGGTQRTDESTQNYTAPQGATQQPIGSSWVRPTEPQGHGSASPHRSAFTPVIPTQPRHTPSPEVQFQPRRVVGTPEPYQPRNVATPPQPTQSPRARIPTQVHQSPQPQQSPRAKAPAQVYQSPRTQNLPQPRQTIHRPTAVRAQPEPPRTYALVQPDTQDFASEPKKCWRCNKTGHRKANCREKIQCTYCGKNGHLEINCRLKEGNNAPRQNTGQSPRSDSTTASYGGSNSSHSSNSVHSNTSNPGATQRTFGQDIASRLQNIAQEGEYSHQSPQVNGLDTNTAPLTETNAPNVACVSEESQYGGSGGTSLLPPGQPTVNNYGGYYPQSPPAIDTSRAGSTTGTAQVIPPPPGYQTVPFQASGMVNNFPGATPASDVISNSTQESIATMSRYMAQMAENSLRTTEREQEQLLTNKLHVEALQRMAAAQERQAQDAMFSSIPLFYGENDREKCIDWLDSVESSCIKCGDRNFKYELSMRAGPKVRAIIDKIADGSTVQKIKNLIIAQFSNVQTYVQATAALRGILQKPDESAAEYVRKYEQLQKRASGVPAAEQTQRNTFTNFAMTLQPELRKRVMWELSKDPGGPTTLKEAYEKAISEEGRLLLSNTDYHEAVTVMEVTEASCDGDVEVNEISTSQNDSKPNRSNYQNNRNSYQNNRNSYQNNRNNVQGNRGNYQNKSNFQGDRRNFQGGNYQNNRPFNSNNQAKLTIGTEYQRTGTNEQILDLMERMKDVKMRPVAAIRGEYQSNNATANSAQATGETAGSAQNATNNQPTPADSRPRGSKVDPQTKEQLCKVMDCSMEVLEIAEAEAEADGVYDTDH
ncbi:MAG: hypothetical protein V3T88_00400, partial [Nitrosomonadaceae bacterium]